MSASGKRRRKGGGSFDLTSLSHPTDAKIRGEEEEEGQSFEEDERGRKEGLGKKEEAAFLERGGGGTGPNPRKKITSKEEGGLTESPTNFPWLWRGRGRGCFKDHRSPFLSSPQWGHDCEEGRGGGRKNIATPP